jgi:tetratricopeptide (TPR) repeat protein
LGDVLKLQTEIATAVANALKVSLLDDVSGKIELGGTRNPDAFDAYLRALKVHMGYHNGKDLQTAIVDYSEAIRLDPHFALAFANQSFVLSRYAANFATGTAIPESYDKARSAALKAIALAPDLVEGHLALARYYFFSPSLDFTGANEEYARALALAPGNARALQEYGHFAGIMGRKEAGIAAARRAVLLDPLNRFTHFSLGFVLQYAHQYNEAISAYQGSLALDPDSQFARGSIGISYYLLGNLQSAQASCQSEPNSSFSQMCLAIIYDKLGRHTNAEAMLAKYRAARGDAAAYQYAEIYAQWGNASEALQWLETALRLRDGGLAYSKTDPLLDPLRKEPRFQAVMRELKFPD